MIKQTSKTILGGFDYSSIELDIKRLIITTGDTRSYNVVLEDGFVPVIIGGMEDENTIPTFSGVLFFELDGKIHGVIDCRQYMKPKGANVNDVLQLASNPNLLITAINRLVLNTQLMKDINALNDLLKPAITIGSMWVSKMIANKYALNLSEILEINIFLSYYYTAMFNNAKSEEEMHEMCLEKTIQINGEQFRTDITFTLEKGKPTNLKELVSAIRTASPKTKHFTLELLMNLIDSTVIAPGGYGTVYLSLEHMPTLLALSYSALTQKLNARSRLGMIISKSPAAIELVEKLKYLQNSII